MKSLFALKAKSIAIFMTGALCGVAYLISCGKVNTNEANANGGTSGFYVKANGVSLGKFVSLNFDTWSSTNNFVVATSTGYLMVLERDGQLISGHIHYTSANCSGTGYMNYTIANKSVFRNGANIYYVAANASDVNGLAYQSVRAADTGNCSATTATGNTDVPVTANDPAVTGVSQTSFTPPITIE